MNGPVPPDRPPMGGGGAGSFAGWAQWGLLAVVLAALLAAYVLLSGPSAALPRPQFLQALVAALDAGPLRSAALGIAALLLAGLVAAGALGARMTGRRSRLLVQALAAEPNGRAISGPDRSLSWCNEAFAEIMADPSGEVFAGLAGRIDGEDSADRFTAMVEAARAGGAGDGEFRATTGDGRAKWLRIQARPLAGQPGCTLWCLEDITARHEMEQVIAEEHRKLADFLENAEIGFYAVDGEGRFVFANQAFGDWVGIPAESLIHNQCHLADVIGGAGADPTRPYSPFADGGAGEEGEATFRRADGSEFQAQVIETLSGERGQGTLTARAIVRDLSAEREFEQILAASEYRFRKLFEDAPAGIAILDGDGVVVECNAAFRRIAAGGGDLTGRPVVELVGEDKRAELTRRLGAAAEGAVADEVIDVTLAESEDGAGALYVTPLEDAEGEASGIILHLFDTTQHRRLEAQFAQSQKLQAVGQLAGGIAHDFNNLLTVMIGFCDLILQRHRPGEQTFADIMQIKQNANRAANLVRQLLAFSRQQTLQPTVLNITDVLGELSNLLRRLIGVNITLEVVHGRDLGLVKVDQVQFEQVIINLAVNARDAMKDGGTLVISTANAEITKPVRRGADVMPPGHYVAISVKDSGTGIAKADLERIFEPFFSTKEVGAGTGLGLSTVYGIVTQTGGFVQVDSQEGVGTEFTIYLPLYEAGAEEEAAEPVAAHGESPAAPAKDTSGVGTVLLVEDEDPVRLFGARALRNKGYTVLEAKNGDSALEIIHDADDPIDLVISDVVMPQLDGPGLVREVRSRFPDMKVIFISGYAEDEFRETLERESNIHFLPKPFSLEQLAGKVKDVLAG